MKIICRSSIYIKQPFNHEICKPDNNLIPKKLVSQQTTLNWAQAANFFIVYELRGFFVVAYCADHASCCGHKVFKPNIFTIYLCSAFKNDVGPCLKKEIRLSMLITRRLELDWIFAINFLQPYCWNGKRIENADAIVIWSCSHRIYR